MAIVGEGCGRVTESYSGCKVEQKVIEQGDRSSEVCEEVVRRVE